MKEQKEKTQYLKNIILCLGIAVVVLSFTLYILTIDRQSKQEKTYTVNQYCTEYTPYKIIKVGDSTKVDVADFATTTEFFDKKQIEEKLSTVVQNGVTRDGLVSACVNTSVHKGVTYYESETSTNDYMVHALNEATIGKDAHPSTDFISPVDEGKIKIRLKVKNV